MTLEEMISKMEDTRVECVTCEHSELTEWLKELKELRQSVGATKLKALKEAQVLIEILKDVIRSIHNETIYGNSPFVFEKINKILEETSCLWKE